MTGKILLVDDDLQILRGYTRLLHGLFDIETAQGGPEGLELLKNQGPFAVVVADMRMPQMDGIEFLSLVKDQAPQSVRIMLTGNADIQTAINAVNNGNVFRFLTKPCPLDILTGALRAGLEQYQLVTAKQELLEKTLSGSFEVLVEVLSLASPVAFSRATRITELVVQIATKLELPEIWRYKAAATLSQIGCITLPPGVLDKIDTQKPLSNYEQEMYSSHPAAAHQIIAHIPRLELIARMIELQQTPANPPVSPAELGSEEAMVRMGGQLLKLALDFDLRRTWGLSNEDALIDLQQQADIYNPHLLAVLEDYIPIKQDETIRKIGIDELKPGMIIARDINSMSGTLLVQQGHEVTLSVFLRLKNFARGIGVVEPIWIRVQPPSDD